MDCGRRERHSPVRLHPGACCDSGLVTLASDTRVEREGAAFTPVAGSPLLRDAGASGLELRVWGTRSDGNQTLLFVVSIGTP